MSQDAHKKLDVSVCACNPSAEGSEVGELGRGACLWLAQGQTQ